jgi:hypothetical protein
MAASTMAKFFSSPCLRYSMRVSSRPALPTRSGPARTGVFLAAGQHGQQRREVLGGAGGGFVAVADAHAAAEVDVRQCDAFGGQCIDQAEQFARGLGGRRRIEQLRADVAGDAMSRRCAAAPAARR